MQQVLGPDETETETDQSIAGEGLPVSSHELHSLAGDAESGTTSPLAVCGGVGGLTLLLLLLLLLSRLGLGCQHVLVVFHANSRRILQALCVRACVRAGRVRWNIVSVPRIIETHAVFRMSVPDIVTGLRSQEWSVWT